MDFAHRLTERNIWVKFNENRSKGTGDMERTGKCYRQTDCQSVSQSGGKVPWSTLSRSIF